MTYVLLVWLLLMGWLQWRCYNGGIDWIQPKVESSNASSTPVRGGEKCLGFQDLPPSLLYAKAGSQDCRPSKVQIESVLSKP
jgi:hypothetical protein